MFDFESYHKAESVDEAIALLAQNPKSIPLAGGTDVLVRLHQHHQDYRHVVDIHGLKELKEISKNPNGVIRIGSGVTFTTLTEHPLITGNIPVLAQGASSVGGPQVRNVGTVGGNICNGAPSADSAAPLLILNATVVLKGTQGQREIPLHEFYQGPGKVDRMESEILTSIVIAPENYQCWFAKYHKYAMRDAMDIATIGCAGACNIEGGLVNQLRLAYTVAGPTPLRCWKTEQIAKGAKADESLLELVKSSVLKDLRPRDSWRASKDFRQHVIQTLAQRVLQAILNQCGEVKP
ncbi:MAG: xanthine dehydrogenase FAD-binding subunit XdhB [Desulfobacteraceae bacterium]|nr:xanthine dehydrogenase FAD-binding subunit XdhB [Desulfobacteraceae bacterium]